MPDWKQEIRQRLASLKLDPTREAEIVEELNQHLKDRYAGIGVSLGLGGALALGGFITGLLFEVKASDPAALVTVALVLGVVALLACWIPAWRAARLDPLVALRCE
ncbi:MAG TPA: hypothetical protein VGV87_05970 [Blastocatellia bacterium]|jgi:ABC-type lipoprotein release transport system permease subunit|nr:hypothetical protein [Blastocatellia bacterium]